MIFSIKSSDEIVQFPTDILERKVDYFCFFRVEDAVVLEGANMDYLVHLFMASLNRHRSILLMQAPRDITTSLITGYSKKHFVIDRDLIFINMSFRNIFFSSIQKCHAIDFNQIADSIRA